MHAAIFKNQAIDYRSTGQCLKTTQIILTKMTFSALTRKNTIQMTTLIGNY